MILGLVAGQACLLGHGLVLPKFSFSGDHPSRVALRLARGLFRSWIVASAVLGHGPNQCSPRKWVDVWPPLNPSATAVLSASSSWHCLLRITGVGSHKTTLSE